MQYENVSVDLSSGAHKADWFAKVCHSAVLPASQTGSCMLAYEHDCLQQTLCCYISSSNLPLPLCQGDPSLFKLG